MQAGGGNQVFLLFPSLGVFEVPRGPYAYIGMSSVPAGKSQGIREPWYIFAGKRITHLDLYQSWLDHNICTEVSVWVFLCVYILCRSFEMGITLALLKKSMEVSGHFLDFRANFISDQVQV